MEKYIYHSKDLRCRIKLTGYKNQMELQLQKRCFLFLWINCFPWMRVNEGFWGESSRLPILRGSCNYGNKSEAYMTGTLDLKKRVDELFREYQDKQFEIAEIHRKFSEL